jgi:hypothetical protein
MSDRRKWKAAVSGKKKGGVEQKRGAATLGVRKKTGVESRKGSTPGGGKKRRGRCQDASGDIASCEEEGNQGETEQEDACQ